MGMTPLQGAAWLERLDLGGAAQAGLRAAGEHLAGAAQARLAEAGVDGARVRRVARADGGVTVAGRGDALVARELGAAGMAPRPVLGAVAVAEGGAAAALVGAALGAALSEAAGLGAGVTVRRKAGRE
ncbi:MAG TPA: hypothetical protein VMI52_09010 [Acetobacteraceae bacterium]|nr:hypothetical protein [Acetobacteraceae bacterium]